MSYAINGQGGTGEVTTYTLAQSEELVLETITWTLATSVTTGRRTPEVRLLTANGQLIARIPDWNDLFESMTVTYTFGIGLTPFCGSINSGGCVQNDLPFASLEPGASIVLVAVDDTGAPFASDTISDVTLWVADLTGAGGGGGGGSGFVDPAAWWLYPVGK